ncbi:MAG: hypothetical protein ACOYLB_16035 [Phototrophicaceae bacterium]
MWAIAVYKSTSLFSLKPASATVSGGRTLLVPTPYAVKMALLDVACPLIGADAAERTWDDWLGGARIALRPSEYVVVNNTFIRILRPPKSPKPLEPFQRTIAYREYAYLGGEFKIGVEVKTEEQASLVGRWLAHINYLGKRGGFVQIQDLPHTLSELPREWLIVGEPPADGIDLDAVLTQLDDTGKGATFQKVSVYSDKSIKLGKERVLHHVMLPYRRTRTSRSYTFYTRIPTEEES